jgi:hypothetical protein
MVKKAAAVVLLGFFGLVAGVAFGLVFPRYQVDYGLLLPANSPHTAPDLVRITRGDLPGVSVTAPSQRIISFSATGSIRSTDRAVNLASKEVIAANDGKIQRGMISNPGQVPPDIDGLKGFLVGLVAALIFLVPPWQRIAASARPRPPWRSLRRMLPPSRRVA